MFKTERKKQQIVFLKGCLDEGYVPKSIVIKSKLGYKDKKVEAALRRAEVCTLKAEISIKSNDVRVLETKLKKDIKVFLESLSVWTREEILEQLWVFYEKIKGEEEERFKKKIRRGRMEEENESKRVKVIGDITITGEEKCFLELGRNFSLHSRGEKENTTILDVEEVLEVSDLPGEEKEEVRGKIRGILKKAKKTEFNISRKEKRGLEILKKRTDIQIMQADKGGAIAVMEKGWYNGEIKKLVEKGHDLVGDEVITAQLKQRNKWLKRLKDSKVISKKEEKKARERVWNTPKIMGFPKLHKKDLKLRPVVSARDDPKKELELVLKRELEGLMSEDDPHRGVRNTEEVVQKIKGSNIQKGKLFSMDIKAMFPSIKRNYVIKCVTEMLNDDTEEKKWIIELLEWVLENAYCRDEENIYRINEGLPIGSKLSPVLAEIVVRKWEERAKEEGGRNLDLWCHYVDDILGNWRGTVRELKIFQKKLNCPEMGIDTELVLEEGGILQFLDIEIIKKENRVERNWFQKECNAGVFCHSRSAVGQQTKMNMIKGLMKRINAICTEEHVENSQKRLECQLMKNGYKRSYIRSLRQSTKNGKEKKKEQEKEKDTRRPWKGISYFGKISEKVKKVLKKAGSNVYFRNGGKLQYILRKKEKEVKPATGVVYKIPCRDCEKAYYGETGRGTETRNKDHIRDLKTGKESSAPFQHWIEEGHGLDFDNTAVLHREDRKISRRLIEGLVIKENRDSSINLVEGKQLSRTWGKENIEKLKKLACKNT